MLSVEEMWIFNYSLLFLNQSYVACWGLIFEELIFTKLMQKHKFGGFILELM